MSDPQVGDPRAGDPQISDPRVSVVIPAYQRSTLIGRAVHSALMQSPAPSEVIVVDDGSTDGTGEAARAAGAVVITQPNSGVGEARNTGIDAAAGTWIALLDSDDQWLPGHLETLLRHAPEHVIVGTVARAVPSGRLYGYSGAGAKRLGPADALWPDNPLVPSATMVRRDVALAAGGFTKEKYAEDLDFWIRVLERGPGIVVPRISCLYHEHPAQASAELEPMQEGRLTVARRYAERDWFPSGLLARLGVLSTWDRFRRDLRGRQLPGAARELTGLARPYAAVALAETFRYRAAARRRGRVPREEG